MTKSLRCLGFLLLVWLPGVLGAQSAGQHCSPPNLNDGYFVPEGDTYSHGSTLTYACNDGLKPAVDGWWATSTCENGNWSHEPQCIDEKACFPTIPNAEYPENSKWFADESVITIKCDKAYEDKNAKVTCINGTWSPVLVCEKSIHACGEPPKIPHAVIIHQTYQEVFAVNSEVQYACEVGYTVERAHSKKSIICKSGNWTDGPTCIRGPTASAGSGTQPSSQDRGTTSGTGHGGSAAVGGPTAGGGSSASSGLIDRDTDLQITRPRHCGDPPFVQHAVVTIRHWYLKYQCSKYYTLVGPDTVDCYSDGTWSEVPTCKATYCSVNTNLRPELKSVGVTFIEDGESVELECVKQPDWWFDHSSEVRCSNGIMTFTPCCNWADKLGKREC